ncbi:MAG: M20/M25/M40 family metallo-hydrolase [Bryobacteraceae bacterium]|jgi:acetylornithine deacetylase/succinyl-diaminopimelate desuccinylase-like protein
MKMLSSLLLLAALAGAQPRYPVDWQKLEPEILERFTALLKIDTSNPPGNETSAAKAVQAVLEREGIPVKLFALDPARANLVARIQGSGAKKPILIMGHTDVVGVQRERWSVDPFAAIRKNGVIYARGSSDDKPHVVAGMMILLLLHRLHMKLDRDVIFLAEAGEEGTTGPGIDFMVRQHWPEIEAEYALAEGGAIVEDNGKVQHVLISSTEKAPRGIRLVARGPAGHGSRPLVENAVVHLAQAVARAGNWQTPMRLNETTRAYFERLAAISPPAEAARYRGILDPSRAAEMDRYFRQHEPTHYSILRTSVVPTILKGGFRNNVIPSEAEAYLDVRALPDEDVPQFLAELRRVIDDPAVEVIPPATADRPLAAPSRIDTDMFRALEKVARRMFDAPTLPNMMTGATDNAQLRVKGVQAYGVGPIVTPAEGPLGGAHSDDEHISVRSLMALIEFLWNAVLEVAAE